MRRPLFTGEYFTSKQVSPQKSAILVQTEFAPLHSLFRVFQTVALFSLFDTFFLDCLNDKGGGVAALYLKKGEKVTAINFDRRIRLIEKKRRQAGGAHADTPHRSRTIHRRSRRPMSST